MAYRASIDARMAYNRVLSAKFLLNIPDPAKCVLTKRHSLPAKFQVNMAVPVSGGGIGGLETLLSIFNWSLP